MKRRERESEDAAVEENNRRVFEGVRDYIALMLESRALLGRHGNWLAFSSTVAAHAFGDSKPFDVLTRCNLEIATETCQGSTSIFVTLMRNKDYTFIDVNNIAHDEGYPYLPEIQNVLATIPELEGDLLKMLSAARDSLSSSMREIMTENRQEILQSIYDGGTEKNMRPTRH